MALLPAVDAHHHLWNLKANRYPWLMPGEGPLPFPGFEALCRDYLLSDFRADGARQAIVKSVHVQAEHDESDPVRETAWLQSVADAPGSGGFPHAIVAFADLAEPGVEAILEGHRRHRNTRGIRQMLNFDPRQSEGPSRHALDKRRDLLADAGFLARFGLLRKFDLSFDMQLFPWQASAAAKLVAAHPDTQFIVNHTLMPMDRSESGLAIWRQGLATLAGFENVAIKISGLGMSSTGWNTETSRRLARETIETFGPVRCLFGSNFPVDRLMIDYDTPWQVFREVVSRYSEDEQRALLSGNAERVYRI
ncbi:amidohydrolase family protein [Myxococcota bacterium]|nr:amidohydrolase family protein [Myxococcota bacterium]